MQLIVYAHRLISMMVIIIESRRRKRHATIEKFDMHQLMREIG
jgi:hypothetical protein